MLLAYWPVPLKFLHLPLQTTSYNIISLPLGCEMHLSVADAYCHWRGAQMWCFSRRYCEAFSRISLLLLLVAMSVTELLMQQKISCVMHSCWFPLTWYTQFKLQVNASTFGAGAVLIQKNPHIMEHPVSCFSSKFLKHQQDIALLKRKPWPYFGPCSISKFILGVVLSQ